LRVETPGAVAIDALGFEFDELKGAIFAHAVVEVLRAVAIRPVAGQPAFIAGVVDVRGSVVPVLSLRRWFGLPPRQLAPEHNFILVRTHGLPLALWVDRVTSIVKLSPDTLRDAQGLVVGTKSLRGIVRTADGLVALHDVSAFVTQAELEAAHRAAHAS
jgi:purine-binding chemotaxis protein CheW